MPGPITPDTYTLDVTGDNGTPFRFVYWPHENGGTVRYHDRRYTLAEGKPGYGINQTNENGMACGLALAVSDFVPHGNIADHGMRGWNEVDAWDIDRNTMRLVGTWLTSLNNKGIGS